MTSCAGVETSIIECEGGGDAGIWATLSLIVDILSIMVGIVAVIAIAIVGIQYLTAGGDVARTTKAKRRLSQIVLGIIIYAVMWSAIQWLLPGGLFFRPDDVDSVSISFTTSSVHVGESLYPTIAITPDTAIDKTYSLKSSDSTIAAIASPAVRCLKVGQATITVITANNKSASATVECTPRPVVNVEPTTPTSTPSPSSNSNTTIKNGALSEAEVNNYFSNHPNPTFDDIVKLAKARGIDTNSDDFTAILAWVEGEGQANPNVAIRPNMYFAYLCASVAINDVKDGVWGSNPLNTFTKWGSYYSMNNLLARANSAKTNIYTLRPLYLALTNLYPNIHNCWGPGGNPSAPAGTVYTWTDNYGNATFVY